jgi:hypothetical protein
VFSFCKVSERALLWDTGIELFDGFEEVLIDTALKIGKISLPLLLMSIKQLNDSNRLFKSCIVSMLGPKQGIHRLNIIKPCAQTYEMEPSGSFQSHVDVSKVYLAVTSVTAPFLAIWRNDPSTLIIATAL